MLDKTSDIRRDGLMCGVLIAATIAVFWQVCAFEFLNFDDDRYVAENPLVQQGLTREGIVWAFTTIGISNWHPLTLLSHMLDCQLFGLNAGAHHMVNVLFHAANAALLFLVLRRMTGALWRSALVAALFALHPLHVESVAWVSERKDVLSAFFAMLTMLTYVWYAKRPSPARCLAVLAPFALGLMAKPMLITLPGVLLLLDFWPLRRIAFNPPMNRATLKQAWSLVFEKLPLIGLSAAAGAIAWVAQHGGKAVAPIELFTLRIRLANAAVSYVRYILKMFYPANLAVPYPHPGHSLTAWQIAGSVALLAVVTVAAVRLARRCPYVLAGWLWYLGMLVPVIGVVQVGSQAMADRYTYLPLIGLFIIVAWGAGDLAWGRQHLRSAFSVGFVAALGALTVCTSFQLSHWRNSVVLFEHALRVTECNSIAHNNLGTALMSRGDFERAKEHFSAAVKTAPDNIDALNNLGVALLVLGRPIEAANTFKQVLNSTPHDATVHSNLGVALLQQGAYDEAEQYLSRALEMDPGLDRARLALRMVHQARTTTKPPS